VNLKIGWKYVFAFFALNGVISELHEQAHVRTHLVLSGCYFERDFNNLYPCAAGTDTGGVLPDMASSMAGPLFSYLVMWFGVWLLARASTPARRSIGFTLIFAPLPFARVFTALMGGGDERGFMRLLVDGVMPLPATRWLAVALTLAFCAPPVWMAWRATANRHRTWLVAGLCVVPLLVVGAYKLLFLNALLLKGVLATPLIFGTPAFVVIVFAFMIVATALSWRWLQGLEGDAAPPSGSPVAATA
jgi:hypothetical protein